MKIGITTFGCDKGRSGIGRYASYILNEFASLKTGDTFELIGLEDELDVFQPKNTPFPTVPVASRWGGAAKNVIWHMIELPGVCRARGYDALFLPAANRRLPWSVPCPTIGTVHDFSILHIPGKYDLTHQIYITKALPRLVRRLSKIIAVSESGRQDIVHYAGANPENVRVIPEAADGDIFFPSPETPQSVQLLKRYNLCDPYLLYVSRIEHPGKNHVRLIRAFNSLKAKGELPEHKLVLAGSDWSGAEAVHLEAERSLYAKDILFLGFVPDSDLPDLYRGADLFVFPSLFEGFGLPLLEAMRCGTPVACANVSSLPEVAGDAAALFDPTDENAIATAIVEIVGDRIQHARFSSLGIARAAEFTWRNAAEKTLALIHETFKPKSII